MRGKLILTGTKIELKHTNARQKDVTQIVARLELSRQLYSLSDAALQGLNVDFDLVGGAPKKIRPVDQAFEEQAPAKPQGRPQPGRGPQSRPQERGDAQPRPAVKLKGEFHNPYNFVPTPPRPSDGEFGDLEPVGHERYHLDRYTGKISVKLTTITPLLLPDAFSATDDEHGHKTFSVRRGSDKKPFLAVTSMKGVLRSAFEAITNSRFGVFPFDKDHGTGHAARLAFRRQAKVDVEPARIAVVRDDEIELHILRQRWLKSPAKLPRYDKRSRQRPARWQSRRRFRARAARPPARRCHRRRTGADSGRAPPGPVTATALLPIPAPRRPVRRRRPARTTSAPSPRRPARWCRPAPLRHCAGRCRFPSERVPLFP